MVLEQEWPLKLEGSLLLVGVPKEEKLYPPKING